MTFDPITAAALERTRESIATRPWSAPDALETFDRACAPVDITGLARHYAPHPCSFCGCDAVELLVTRESDEITDTGEIIMYACRVCVLNGDGDYSAFDAPDAEVLTGDAIDCSGEQLGMFDVPRASTMPGRAAARVAGQLEL